MVNQRDLDSPNDSLETLSLQIGRANGFDTDALDANRSGKLTNSQRAKFLFIFSILLIGGLAGAMLLIILFVLEADRLEGAWWLIPLVLVIVLLALLLLRRQADVVLDHLLGKVASIEGAVTKDVVSSTKYEDDRSAIAIEYEHEYYYKLKRKRFYINEAGYSALREGRIYRLYFLPRSKKLVNIEVIELK